MIASGIPQDMPDIPDQGVDKKRAVVALDDYFSILNHQQCTHGSFDLMIQNWTRLYFI